jgi:hypothetical protein
MSIHSGSAANRNPLINARRELADRVTALEAERAALLATTVDTYIGLQPANAATEQVQRRAGIVQAAERLVKLDSAIATATADVAAADELLAAFNTALS